jgi:hypothetical protein
MLPESESTAEVHKTGHRMADLSIALSALFISLCSVGLAIHHGHAMDRLVEANSRPFLQFTSNNADPTANDANGVPAPVLDVWVDNPGSGPARIEWFKIEVDGRQVKDWREGLGLIQERAIADGKLPGSVPISFTSGDVAPAYLKAGNQVKILHWPRTAENGTLWDVADATRRAGRIRLAACYCSIFEQCWIADMETFRPKPVEKCEPGAPMTL